MKPESGTVLDGRFRLLERLGAGGMGTVHRAWDEATDSAVAVKILDVRFLAVDAGEMDRIRRRFQREARLLQTLAGCEQVVQYVDSHLDGDCWYIAMELVQGPSLRNVVEMSGGSIEPARFLILAEQIIIGLKAIHAHRILHRDLAPDNIVILRRGSTRLLTKFLDFGIGKSMETEIDPVTEMPTIMGKPQYLSPEQTLGSDLTASSDVYALGVILYEMLTGELPIGVQSFAEVARVRKEEPVPLAAFKASALLPEELRALVMACLDKDPAKRPTTDELNECVSELRRRHDRGQDISAAFSEWELSQLLDDDDPGMATRLAAGTAFGKYEVRWLISQSAQSELWMGVERGTDREVALTVFDPGAPGRWRDAARQLSETGPPSVARVVDSGDHEGMPFIATEPVRGTPLARTFEESGAMEPARVLQIVDEILDALVCAHELEPPLVHGSLSSRNVFLDDFDSVTLVEFGLECDPRRIDPIESTSESVSGLPPEQALGLPASPAADVYAVGCLLYQMMTGSPPFAGSTMAVLFAHAETAPKPPIPPADAERRFAPSLAPLVLHCLQKRAADRPVIAEVRRRFDAAFADADFDERDPDAATVGRPGLLGRLRRRFPPR